MKKHLLGIFAIILALGSSAFSIIKDKEANKFQQEYYWFGLTSNYLGRSASAPPECTGGSFDCAYGYISVANPANPQQPTSNPDLTARKPTP